MNIAFARISKELVELNKNKEKDGITIETIGNSLNKLKGFFYGPCDTPYEGGKFEVLINIPDKYPFVPPIVTFETKIWHPNVSSVTGVICLDILKNAWAAAMSIRTVIISIQALLCNPEPDDPQDAVVASQMTSNKAVFNLIAKQWTRIYAHGPDIPLQDQEFDNKVRLLIERGVRPEEAITTLCNNNLDIERAVERYFR